MGFALADNIDRSLAFHHLDENESPSNFQAQNGLSSTEELTSDLIQDDRIDFLRGTLDEPKLVVFMENDPNSEVDWGRHPKGSTDATCCTEQAYDYTDVFYIDDLIV